MPTTEIEAVVTADGLWINGHLFNKQVPVEHYHDALGTPSRTVAAGPPAPYGHRNNHVHYFDSAGIYLTEHHASRLIESVNFVFDLADSPFPVDKAFSGCLKIDGRQFRSGMKERDLALAQFRHDLAGEYSLRLENCRICISTMGRRVPGGKRRKPRYLVGVSVGL
jgi:hypothetical protein